MTDTASPAQEPAPTATTVQRAFGEENRNRLLDRYFTAAPPLTAETAWEHVYKLLLWTDPTTGLAHCYESDKAQPGRPWYARTLAFHAWVADALGSSAHDLGSDIDLLFRWATEDLAAAAAARRAAYATEAAKQREPYADRQMPQPGEDPELADLIVQSLHKWLSEQPPDDVLRSLTERIRAHVGQENKRKNLVGEGFEDTLAAILRRIPEIADYYDVRVRPPLHDLPGFYAPRQGEKTKKVDLALVRQADGYRTLVSCKWSVRSDREEQFATDWTAYARLERANQAFGYVLVTNEFDPARLAAACESRQGPNLLFTDVVHVNPQGPIAAYDAPVPARGRGIGRARSHIDSGRLASLGEWLTGFASSPT